MRSLFDINRDAKNIYKVKQCNTFQQENSCSEIMNLPINIIETEIIEILQFFEIFTFQKNYKISIIKKKCQIC